MARVLTLGRSQPRDYRLLAFGSSAWNTAITPGGESPATTFEYARAPPGALGVIEAPPGGDPSRPGWQSCGVRMPWFDPFAEALAGR